MEFNTNSFNFAQSIVKRHKRLKERIHDLVLNGYTLGTRYTLKTSGHLSPCSIEVLTQKPEIRMIVGYRNNHHSREAICVIWDK